MTPGIDLATARADIDLRALRENLRTLAAHTAPARLMLVVKADAYGHGMLRCAAAAREAGVEWLGVATPAEALALREDGDTGLLLAWLYGVDEDLTPLVAAGVDVSVQSPDQVSRVVAAAAVTERRARVHLKVDTGLSRNGAAAAGWAQLFDAAVEAEQAGAVEVVALWSHLASADEPGHPATALQVAAFEQAWSEALEAGLRPQLRHLANSAGAMVLPEARYDLVRVGIAAYGVEPAPGLADLAGIHLRPVMTLRATLANVKQIPAGVGVSYGWTWTAPARTTVGLVPLGYADGIPRHASNRAAVALGAGRVPVRGRICMDQFVVELGPDSTAEAGAEVVLFGPGDSGEPTAADWAGWCDTIGYEIVTRIGPRVPRRHLGGDPSAGDHVLH